MTSYWAFLGNPKTYRVEKAVKEKKYDLWTTKGRPVSPGDYVIIWKAKGNETERGIISLGKVETAPSYAADASNIHWINERNAYNSELRVKVRYFSGLPGLPLWIGGKADHLLVNLSVARATGGTVFYVTEEQWNSLLDYLGIKNIENYK